MSERLLASERLKLRRDFLQVSGSGHKVHSARFLFLVLSRGDEGPTRLGITVTRKVANAVGRNRIKRVVREVFRKNRSLFPLGCDLVVIAKDRAPGLSYADTRDEVELTSRSLLRAGQRPRKSAPSVSSGEETRPVQKEGQRNQPGRGPVRAARVGGPRKTEG